MKQKAKKILQTFGGVAVTTVPLSTVLSCGADEPPVTPTDPTRTINNGNFSWPAREQFIEALQGDPGVGYVDSNLLPNFPKESEGVQLQWKSQNDSSFGTLKNLNNDDSIKLKLAVSSGYKLSKPITESDSYVIDSLTFNVNVDEFKWPPELPTEIFVGDNTTGWIDSTKFPDLPKQGVIVNWYINDTISGGGKTLQNNDKIKLVLEPKLGYKLSKDVGMSPEYSIPDNTFPESLSLSDFNWPDTLPSAALSGFNGSGKIDSHGFTELPSKGVMVWWKKGAVQPFDVIPNLSNGDEVTLKLKAEAGYNLTDIPVEKTYPISGLKTAVDTSDFQWPITIDPEDFYATQPNNGMIKQNFFLDTLPFNQVKLSWKKDSESEFGTVANLSNNDQVALRIEALDNYGLTQIIADKTYTINGMKTTVDTSEFKWPTKMLEKNLVGEPGNGSIDSSLFLNGLILENQIHQVNLEWKKSTENLFGTQANLTNNDQVTFRIQPIPGAKLPTIIEEKTYTISGFKWIVDVDNFSWSTDNDHGLDVAISGPNGTGFVDQTKIPGFPTVGAQLQWTIIPEGLPGSVAELSDGDYVQLNMVALDGFRLSKEIAPSTTYIVNGFKIHINMSNFQWKNSDSLSLGTNSYVISQQRIFIFGLNVSTYANVDLAWKYEGSGDFAINTTIPASNPSAGTKIIFKLIAKDGYYLNNFSNGVTAISHVFTSK